MVDGTLEARQAHGRPFSLEFRRSSARYFPTSTPSEPQCQSPPKSTELGEYAGSGEEIVQETVSSIFEGWFAKEEGLRLSSDDAQWQCEETWAILVYEEDIRRETAFTAWDATAEKQFLQRSDSSSSRKPSCSS
jgi:hypothetical protein